MVFISRDDPSRQGSKHSQLTHPSVVINQKMIESFFKVHLNVKLTASAMEIATNAQLTRGISLILRQQDDGFHVLFPSWSRISRIHTRAIKTQEEKEEEEDVKEWNESKT